ncbi:Cu(I)-responsive transcriptional regulator [Phaeobacter gallaeciensis]|uniref:Cu(I)-responsive transcriptional regulator n=2 Tax=Roseobacteraceae TaxID=2854170 RepID=A0A366WZG4_9RHOB|nr:MULTISPECIES: Cu(I)-responsive transcriptional regulator [Roseobacteraceae]MBT3143812.1 Cu(I)-responsive transcriptional regulator [Falsiruegeria litorea]MBT8169523.1 Cu(I)-responsive transcriptional regulator [Falsiruegeria litorea]RBW53562.1 Cu(I)-responsive transcriptional regulator [Phaeobacter gallaeciensis]
MNIGDVAERSGVPPKTIRYYEDIGFIKPHRLANGYRDFEDKDLHKLVFIGRARSLGFSIEDCRTLLALYDDDARTSADVKQVAEQNLREIEAKISDLQAMHSTLSHLISECAGDQRPDCPILQGLSQTPDQKG